MLKNKIHSNSVLDRKRVENERDGIKSNQNWSLGVLQCIGLVQWPIGHSTTTTMDVVLCVAPLLFDWKKWNFLSVRWSVGWHCSWFTLTKCVYECVCTRFTFNSIFNMPIFQAQRRRSTGWIHTFTENYQNMPALCMSFPCLHFFSFIVVDIFRPFPSCVGFIWSVFFSRLWFCYFVTSSIHRSQFGVCIRVWEYASVWTADRPTKYTNKPPTIRSTSCVYVHKLWFLSLTHSLLPLLLRNIRPFVIFAKRMR